MSYKAQHIFSEIVKLANSAKSVASSEETRQTAVEISFAAQVARDNEFLATKNSDRSRQEGD